MTDTKPDRYRSIRYGVADRVATITLDRPDRLNAIDRHMPREIEAAVARANEDDAVHVIVIEGTDGSFCAGADMGEALAAAGPDFLA